MEKRQVVQDVVRTVDGKDEIISYAILCPACKDPHIFDKRWNFNGDHDKPTFSPSMLVSANEPNRRCHSHVVDGRIEYLGDCFHAMKNQKIELQPWTWKSWGRIEEPLETEHESIKPKGEGIMYYKVVSPLVVKCQMKSVGTIVEMHTDEAFKHGSQLEQMDDAEGAKALAAQEKSKTEGQNKMKQGGANK